MKCPMPKASIHIVYCSYFCTSRPSERSVTVLVLQQLCLIYEWLLWQDNKIVVAFADDKAPCIFWIFWLSNFILNTFFTFCRSWATKKAKCFRENCRRSNPFSVPMPPIKERRIQLCQVWTRILHSNNREFNKIHTPYVRVNQER